MDKTVKEVFYEEKINSTIKTISKYVKNDNIIQSITGYIKDIYYSSYPHDTYKIKKVSVYTNLNTFLSSIRYKNMLWFLNKKGIVSYTDHSGILSSIIIRSKKFKNFYQLTSIIKYAICKKGIVVILNKTLYIYYKEEEK